MTSHSFITALAEAPAVPVAWEYANEHGNKFVTRTNPNEWHPHDRQCFKDFTPLYATPPQAPQPTDQTRDAHFGGHSYEASLLRDLLARIHRDGGHYVAEHGMDKAVADADMKIADMFGLLEQALEALECNVIALELLIGMDATFWHAKQAAKLNLADTNAAIAALRAHLGETK